MCALVFNSVCEKYSNIGKVEVGSELIKRGSNSNKHLLLLTCRSLQASGLPLLLPQLLLHLPPLKRLFLLDQLILQLKPSHMFLYSMDECECVCAYGEHTDELIVAD